ncbi:uncharacterized protein GLRG_00402 [Colletotrichum graminicola M1.001]|uniref:Uncharacterized protein n=1 Tax=Colletotrichum graminicola (strain M1.001 / M2 / FGSC 10212) TaxID=645133 RepID=E3Q2F7_COLGM|nr:uncharacterized protein GLRG_00402 [Colletotrichum graminicola M1.001]EFQ25258.1 hypothetical protein GLRG_00402 [Colletotrichum graminicola M1.001]
MKAGAVSARADEGWHSHSIASGKEQPVRLDGDSGLVSVLFRRRRLRNIRTKQVPTKASFKEGT